MPVFEYLIAPVTDDPRAQASRFGEAIDCSPAAALAEPVPASLQLDRWPAVRASCRRSQGDHFLLGIDIPNGCWCTADAVMNDLLAQINRERKKRPIELVRRLPIGKTCLGRA